MRIIKEFIILMLGAAAVIYLFLPSLLPDLVPFIGWLDEGIATTILLSTLKHWGLDFTGLFGDDKVKNVPPVKQADTVTVETGTGQKMQKVRIPREVLERALAEYQQEQQYSQR